jgi:hypothetical protein
MSDVITVSDYFGGGFPGNFVRTRYRRRRYPVLTSARAPRSRQASAGPGGTGDASMPSTAYGKGGKRAPAL